MARNYVPVQVIDSRFSLPGLDRRFHCNFRPYQQQAVAGILERELGVQHVLIRPELRRLDRITGNFTSSIHNGNTGQVAKGNSRFRNRETKEPSLSMARRLFPWVDLSRKKDHGKSDALLLALYACRFQQTSSTGTPSIERGIIEE